MNSENLLSGLIDAAKRAGADAADALYVENLSASVSYRLGKLEDVERSESADLGLRVFLGNKVAFVSSTDFSADALAQLPERAMAMAVVDLAMAAGQGTDESAALIADERQRLAGNPARRRDDRAHLGHVEHRAQVVQPRRHDVTLNGLKTQNSAA